ncbi:MAG: NAD(P)-dependent oxidoreductase [Sphingobacteriales bacterium]|nr:MAG: NAD(P)-dependent oxidoreductase [Sphingobacteriales bacterium]
MREKVLITGASGFIGYHLIEKAQNAGLEVYAAIRPSSDVSHLASLGVNYITLGYSDTTKLQKDLEAVGFHYIIHAAGSTKAKTQADYDKVNAEFTRNLGIAAANAAMPLKKFLFLSSLAAIGPTGYNDPKPICELSKANPVTSYGKSKMLAEKYLSELKLPLITLRPTAVYGPREKDIYIMFKTLNMGLEPYIGRGQQTFSFVYATDIAQIAVDALRSNVENKAYNVSDGGKYSRYELADITKSVLGKKTFRFHVPMGIVKVIASSLETMYAKSDKSPAINREKLFELTAENWFCSIDRIQADLGYEPRYNLEKGLTETIQWYKANKWL